MTPNHFRISTPLSQEQLKVDGPATTHIENCSCRAVALKQFYHFGWRKMGTRRNNPQGGIADQGGGYRGSVFILQLCEGRPGTRCVNGTSGERCGYVGKLWTVI